MSSPRIRRHTEQCSKFNDTDFQLQSSYWDNLSKIWLTKRALKELNCRNKKSNECPPPYRRSRRPLTRSLLTKWAKDQQSTLEIPNSFSADDLEKVERFARQGGPDTSDLRGVFIAGCPYFTEMLIICTSIQNLAILLNTPRCYLQTIRPPQRTKTPLIQSRPRIQAPTLATLSRS